MGFACTAGAAAYLKLAEVVRGWLRWTLPACAISLVVVAHFVALRFRPEGWNTTTFYEMNGTDQLVLFGRRYLFLAWAAFSFGAGCFLYDTVREWKVNRVRRLCRGPLELWAILLLAAAMIPEHVWVSRFAGVVGFIVSRLTSITAVLALCVLATAKPRAWHIAGFGLLAAVFFAWTYKDTGVLSRMEAQAETLVSSLPYGRRVTETIAAGGDSRIWFIHHMVDRACIGRCFTYSNYEAPSLQFRIRARPGNPIVTTSFDDSYAMQAGDYKVLGKDLPMNHIYQCDKKDSTRLCIRELTTGEVNGRLGRDPHF
jgi:hypothetical protein